MTVARMDGEGTTQQELFWLTEAQMERLRPFLPLSRGKPRVDDLRVLSGIIYVNRNRLRWRDAPATYGPSRTLYNRWVRWNRTGVFGRIIRELERNAAAEDGIVAHARHLTDHQRSSSRMANIDPGRNPGGTERP